MSDKSLTWNELETEIFTPQEIDESKARVDMLMTPTIGEILREEFMDPMHISAYQLAQATFVPVSRIQDILHDRRKMTADTSIRLGRFFGISERYFLNLQNDIDIRNETLKHADELNRIQPMQRGHKKIQHAVVSAHDGPMV